MPAITSYYGAFQDSKHIYIVMEYCARGDLLERLLSEGRAFSEVSSRFLQLLSTAFSCCSNAGRRLAHKHSRETTD